MLMSIFSSIDALCAESLGRKIFLTNNNNLNIPKHSSSTEAVKTDDEHHNRSPSSSPDVKKSSKLQIIWPRFAPELDGLNCFETIVPY